MPYELGQLEVEITEEDLIIAIAARSETDLCFNCIIAQAATRTIEEPSYSWRRFDACTVKFSPLSNSDFVYEAEDSNLDFIMRRFDSKDYDSIRPLLPYKAIFVGMWRQPQ